MAIVKRGSCSKLSTLQVVKCEFICESCKHEEKLTVENSREDHIVCSKCKGKMSVIEK